MRAILIADSGSVLANLTRALVEIDGVEIARHASGRTHVEALVHSFAPDLVLVDEMHWPPRALARIAEVRRAAPGAAIIVLAEQLEGAWLAEALRMGASAVMPDNADVDTFRRILAEVMTPARAAA